ncbi:hypothetical protein Dimus_017012 [Dionaea muscipula]
MALASSGSKLLTAWVDALQILANRFFTRLCILALRLIYRVLSVGPLPNHVAFIMDGNRRYARKHKLKDVDAYQAGSSTLLSTLRYCCQLGIKYITVYAFSIDNFKRQPEDVKILMDLMLEKIERLLEEESVLNEYGIRLWFAGDLGLLNEPVRVAAHKVMAATAGNAKAVLLICVAYTSTDEIVHAIRETSSSSSSSIYIKTRQQQPQEEVENLEPPVPIMATAMGPMGPMGMGRLTVTDIERHMYMALAPEPDMLVRTSGETRLSNFLLWQTRSCLLYSPAVLWPEFGLCHLIWALFNFQRHHHYLDKKKKQM